jgi:ABC-2 type transport system ATP-binding protein
VAHVVEVRELRRAYGSFEALKGVSFAVERGQIVGLLGPNGAGKSTTMKILTTWLAPTGGSASVCGHDVLTEPLEVRRKLGYLPESAPVYGEMAVEPYLEFVGRVRGLGAAERARAVRRVSEECGLLDRQDQRISTLSKGYRQRVGLAQALLHSPELLILDEPTNGLDPNQIVEIRELIRRIGETRTVMLSTHILSEVQVTCDRVLIIHQGQLVADDRTDAVLTGGTGQRVTLGLAQGKVVVTEDALMEQLGALPGVRRVGRAAPVDEAMRFALEAEGDVREAVFRWAVAGGHVVVELSAARSNLEEVFRRLTVEHGEAA